ncbi:MAG: glycosyltransferase family A protein [Bacteroidota bacterium]|nr:glycosyltransferase family A protein [Bacteroidota bacterium]
MISVVIPFRNRFDLVKRCLNSVLNQSYNNFEIILIDDESKEVFESGFEDSRIHLIRNEKNIGPGLSRNSGMKLAKGTYLAFLDSDDYWHPDFLRLTFEKLSKNPTSILCYTFTNNVIDNHVVSVYKNNKYAFDKIVPTIFIHEKVWANSSCLWNFSFIKGKVYFEDIRAWEDYLFDFTAALQSNHISCVPKLLCYYDMGALEKLSNSQVNIPDKLIAVTKISKLLKTSDLKSDPAILNSFINCYGRMISSRGLDNTRQEISESLNELYSWTGKIYLHPIFSILFLSRSRKLRTYFIRRKLLGIPHPNKRKTA